MKEREIYSGIRVLPPLIVRLDGRAFHHLTADLELKKPYDERFASVMANVTTSLVKESGLAPLFGYTFSDEISLYFDNLPFDGRVEKIDSVLAS